MASNALTILTWNLAMMTGSDQAPPGWGVEHTEAAVRDRVLSMDPDVVLFQELPRAVPYVETHDMMRANPETHQGNLATLVRRELLAREKPGPEVVTVAGCGLLTTFADGLTVANVHLAPGPGAVGERLEQLARVVEASPTPDLVIVGDTNTRRSEEEALADAGLVGKVPPRPTWDSKGNRFHADGPAFAAYFTRWFATERVVVEAPKVWHQPTALDEHQFHLSDHHALSITVRLD